MPDHPHPANPSNEFQPQVSPTPTPTPSPTTSPFPYQHWKADLGAAAEVFYRPTPSSYVSVKQATSGGATVKSLGVSHNHHHHQHHSTPAPASAYSPKGQFTYYVLVSDIWKPFSLSQ